MNNGDHATVLLVQSDPDALGLYTEALENEGFLTYSLSDGPSAVEVARSADIIVTGVHGIGAIDGLELLELLRSDEATRDKPVVVITAWRIERSRREALAAGCNAFLPKPCVPDELVSQVRRFVALTRVPPAPEPGSWWRSEHSVQEPSTDDDLAQV
jgi:two-component system, cell cycle response regulator DivK